MTSQKMYPHKRFNLEIFKDTHHRLEGLNSSRSIIKSNPKLSTCWKGYNVCFGSLNHQAEDPSLISQKL